MEWLIERWVGWCYAAGPFVPVALAVALAAPSARIVFGEVPAPLWRRGVHAGTFACVIVLAGGYFFGARLAEREDGRFAWGAAVVAAVICSRAFFAARAVRFALVAWARRNGSRRVSFIGRAAGGLLPTVPSARRASGVFGVLRRLHAVRGLPPAGGFETDEVLMSRAAAAASALRDVVDDAWAAKAAAARTVEELTVWLKWRHRCFRAAGVDASSAAAELEAARNAVWSSLVDLSRTDAHAGDGGGDSGFADLALRLVASSADVRRSSEVAPADAVQSATDSASTAESVLRAWTASRTVVSKVAVTALERCAAFAVASRCVREGRLERARDVLAQAEERDATAGRAPDDNEPLQWVSYRATAAALDAAESRPAELGGFTLKRWRVDLVERAKQGRAYFGDRNEGGSK